MSFESLLRTQNNFMAEMMSLGVYLGFEEQGLNIEPIKWHIKFLK